MIDESNNEASQVFAAAHNPDLQIQAAAFEQLWEYLLRVALQLVNDQSDAPALAQDCAQLALVRIHQRMDECSLPAAFFGWARRIASNIVFDELRRRKRLVPLVSEEDEETPGRTLPDPSPSPEAATLEHLSLEKLVALIAAAPISTRSRRVVLGRYVEDLPDEQLARHETLLIGAQVLPSHIQVTRTKDLARLSGYDPVRIFFKEIMGKEAEIRE